MNWIVPATLIAILLALAIPGASRQRPWLGYLHAAALSFAGVMVPLFLFLASFFLLPDWKGGCRCGWIDGFLVGKFALSPLVLFAAAALYRLEILDPYDRKSPWAAVGIYCGAVTSTLCVVYAVACLDFRSDPVLMIGLVVCYVPAWYIWRAFQLPLAPAIRYLWATLGMVPFWVWTWIWSHRVFAALPDTQPHRCFVVTAAGRGHGKLVGPFLEVEHRGAITRANRQLIRFWRLEDLWRARSSSSHRLFRLLYNRIGPRLAARVTSPWRADLVFVILKPFEWIVCLWFD